MKEAGIYTESSSRQAIKLASVVIGYKNKPLMSDISIVLPQATTVALLGANGVGKSTLLRTIIGELPALGGEVSMLGKNIRDYSKRSLAKSVAIVTTDPIQAGALRVRELVALGRHPHTGFAGRLHRHDREIVARSIHAVGLDNKTDSFIAELSDGERQKAMIARALAQDTKIIILDEPFSFIDSASRISLLSLIKRISSEQRKTVLFSSHDVSQALRMADSVAIISHDRKLFYGSPRNIIEQGIVDRMFPDSGVAFSQTILDFVPITES